MSAAHILVVDDEPDIRRLIREILEDEGYKVDVAEGADQARERLTRGGAHLMLLDIWMPGTDGVSLLKELAESGSGLPCPVVMMSGHGTVETAVEATRLGAYDFLEKPLSLAKLLLTVERALEAEQLRRENIGLKRQAMGADAPLGKSPLMEGLRAQAGRIAQHDPAWVLIHGEPGSGKLCLAHFLHQHSPRAQGPLVEIRVGSILRENAAVELFGNEDRGRISHGRLEQAHKGTLLLDDIADMDEETQSRLVSALEAGSFLRVGGAESVALNVRVVALTQKNLEEQVAAGRFREDLYYLLNVVPLNVPPLRDHVEDLPELLAHYLDEAVHREGLPYKPFSIAAQNRLRQYHWPGNTRELRNLVQRLLILSPGDEISLEEVDLALGGTNADGSPTDSAGAGMDPGFFDRPLKEAREGFEKAYLLHHLNGHDGSVAAVARAAGMERTNLYRKLKTLGIEFK